MNTYTLPAGKYTIGDLCYVIPDELWSDFLEDGFFIGKVWNGAVALNTLYGDGLYRDQSDRLYPVDAGLIGVIPYQPEHEECFGVHHITFESDFTVYSDPEGFLYFGNVVIDTGYSKEDFEEEEYEEEE